MNTLNENSIPYIFREIFLKNLSGTLKIQTERFDSQLFFMDGTMSFAKTSKEEDRLSNLLIKEGKITSSQLDKIEQLPEFSNEKMGILLVKNGILTQKELYKSLVHQMNEIASTAFFTSKGSFTFENSPPVFPEDSKFSISCGELIRDNCVKINVPELFKKNHSNMIPVSTGNSGTYQKIVEPRDLALAREISSMNHMVSENIPQYLNINKAVYWNRLFYFYLVNMIIFQEPDLESGEDTVISNPEEQHPSLQKSAPTNDTSESVKEVEEIYENLKSGKLNYYQYFKIDSKATKSEIREAYFRMAKKFHPDKVEKGVNKEVLEKANFVFTSLNRAYEVLSKSESRSEYDAAGQKDSSSDDSNDTPPAEKAANAFKKAQTYYKKNELVKACALLEDAVKNDGEKGNYHYLLGICQASISHKRRDAEKSFIKSSELNPWDPKPFIALAKFFIQEGLNSRAIHYLNQAQSVDPENRSVENLLQKLTGKGKKSSNSMPFSWLFNKKK